MRAALILLCIGLSGCGKSTRDLDFQIDQCVRIEVFNHCVSASPDSVGRCGYEAELLAKRNAKTIKPECKGNPA